MKKPTLIHSICLSLLMVISLDSVRSQEALKPDILKSPTAESMGSYGNIPFTSYTGQANVSIPLTSISTNGKVMDVQLSYDGGGVMIDQHAGWTGQGWNLNVGGVINRTVHGEADEDGKGKGMYYYGQKIPYFESIDSIQMGLSESNTNTYSELVQIALKKKDLYATKTVDTEPDMFSFNFMGMSGKFFLSQDGHWKVISDHNLKVDFDFRNPASYQDPFWPIIPATNELRKFEPVIKGFIITDDKGYKYTFGHDTSAIEYSINFFKHYSTPASPYFQYPTWVATAWYLTKVQDFYGNVIFDLEYERSYFIGQVNINFQSIVQSCKQQNGDWIQYNNSYNNNASGSLISPVYLKEISSINKERIEFKISNTIEQKFPHTGAITNQTNEIKNKLCEIGLCGLPPYYFLSSPVYSVNIAASYNDPFDGLMWKKLDTIKVYQNTNQLINKIALEYNNVATQRLHLINVRFLPSTSNLTNAYAYNMEYDGMTDLPSYFSNKLDHFGYYNNNVSYWTSNLYNFDLWQANYYTSRNSNPAFVGKGLLKKLKYPTGGHTEFDYEIHDYNQILSNDRQSIYTESGIIGGVRIKEIRNYDGLSPIATSYKKYKYVSNYSSGGTLSSGILSIKPTYVWIDWVQPSWAWPTGGYKNSIWSNNILVPFTNKFESHIAYKEVVEINADSSYTIFVHNTHLDLKDDLPYSNLNVAFSPYARYSDKSHLRGKTVLTKHYNKNNDLVQSITNHYNLNVNGTIDYGISTDASYDYTCFAIFDDKYFKGNAIKIFCNKSVLDSTVVKTYYGSNVHYSTTYHTYDSPVVHNNRYLFPIKRSVKNSDNAIHMDAYSYPYNYVSPVSGQQAMLDTMKARHRYEVVQQLTSVNAITTDGQRSIFKLYNGHPLLEKIQRYEVSYGVSWVNQWIDQYTIDNYNLTFLTGTHRTARGWLQEQLILNSSGKPTKWSYGAHSRMLTYLPNDKLDMITDIDGQQYKYEYDNLSRINKILQLPKNVESRFTYHFSNALGDVSYFKTHTKYPMQSGSALDSIVQIDYVDGLGRVVQSINKYGSADPAHDALVRTSYDAIGRVNKKYTVEEVQNNHGQYATSTPIVPYHLTEYYKDPLNRAYKSTPASWYASQMDYNVNTASITAADGKTYPIASLHKMTTIDPDGKKSIDYTDILQRKICEIKSNNSESVAATTWYIYDDKSRLSKVVPPGATLSTPSLIFEYRYDGSDNIIYKKVPDAVAEEYVYNDRDLLIGMRNGILTSQGKWLVTHYDDYGRPIKRGYHNLSSALPSADNPTIHTLLEEYFYDGYNGSTTISLPIYKGKLRKKRIKALDDLGANALWTETEYAYDNYGRVVTTSGVNHRGNTETTMMSYDFADHLLSQIHNISGAGSVNHVMKHTYDHQGRLIDDRIKVDGGTEITTATHLYNHRSEVIEKNIGRFATTGTHQYLQSLDYTYNAQGWLTKINELFSGTLPSGPDPCQTGGTSSKEAAETTTVSNTDDEDLFALKLDYDAPVLGVPINKNGNISGQSWHHKGQYAQYYGFTYDFLDRVIDAKHADPDNYPMDADRYTERMAYDIRGNIAGLRRRGVTHRSDINGACYKSATIDSLVYTYGTSSNILTKVDDYAPCPDVITLPSEIDRDAHYAANQKIIVDHTEVDCNAYLHLTVGNLPTYKKIEVNNSFIIPATCATTPTVLADVGPCPQDKYTPGFNQQSTATYQYDASGNMTYDPNKKLTFYYNYLNLPYKIKGAENDELRMLYSADGTLLQRKYVQDIFVRNKVDYIMDKEYHNDTLEYIHHADGRIIKQGSTWQYEYSITDHLGNVRATFCDLNGNGIISNNERRSKIDYYSFGMEHYNAASSTEYTASKNNYKYNGKEQVEEMGWNNMLYGARNYDASIGRFSTIDRYADKYAFISPYQYGANNPVKYVDVNGDSIRVGDQVWTPGKKYEGNDKFIQNVFSALNSLFENIQKDGAGNVSTKEAEGNVIMDFVGSDEHDVNIIETDGYSETSEDGTLIQWNPQETTQLVKDRQNKDSNGEISASTNLAHEFGHSWLAQFSPIMNKNFEYVDRKNDLSLNEHSWILKNVENSFSKSRKEGVRKIYRRTFNGINEYLENKKAILPLIGDIRILKPFKK